jgi:hypothetical protein
MNKAIIKIFSIQFSLALFSFVAVYYCNVFIAYSVGLLMVLLASWFSWNELDGRLNIKATIKNKFKKNG